MASPILLRGAPIEHVVLAGNRVQSHRSVTDAGRALRLFFRLNADLINYTPLSHRARRAARILPRLCAVIAKAVQS
jgi:hypothetical protein